MNPTLSPGSRKVDVYPAASRCIFDFIGSVGVDHQFDSLGNWEGSGGKLFQKYERMQLLGPGAMGFRMLLSLTWPLIDKIWVSNILSLLSSSVKAKHYGNQARTLKG